MSAQPPFNGELGTDDRPTAVSTDVLELLTADADSLVGLGFDAAETDDGVIIFDGESGDFSNAVAWVDGTAHPVTSVEWVDSSGTARPVTEWHLGPRSFFAVTITGTNSPVTAGETLTISADVTNTGATTASDTIYLQRAGNIYYTETVSDLAPGATASITLSWDTQSGDAGDYTFEVASSDDSESTSVTVQSGFPPSSAIHRWKLDDVASGTATDSIGSADGTVYQVSSVSGIYQGGAAAAGDGENDSIDVTEFSRWSEDRKKPWAVGFTVDNWSNPDFEVAMGCADDSSDNQARIYHYDSNLYWAVAENNTFYSVKISNPGIFDGGKYRVLVGMDASSGTTKGFIDNSSQSITNAITDLLPTDDTANPVGNTTSLFAQKSLRHTDAILDDVIVYDTLPDASLAQSDYNAQPWS